MGGSVLGSEAIYEFLKTKIKKKFFFLNNLDLETIDNLKKKISTDKSLFIIISKSGNTIETLSNTFLLCLKEYTTFDKLLNLACCLEVPNDGEQ